MDDLDDLLGRSILDTPIRVTHFADRQATTKQSEVVSLRRLSATIGEHVSDIKADLPWIKLATFGDARTSRGSLRHADNMLAVSGVEGDYDGENVSVARAAARLRDAGIAAWLYTSPSHTANAPRWRVLAPLSREHAPGERADLVGRLNAALGGILAQESFTAAQSYYFGRLTDSPDFESVLVPGAALDRLALAPQFPSGALNSATSLGSDELAEKRAAAEKSFGEDVGSGRLASALQAITDNPKCDDTYRGDWSTVVQALCHASGGSRVGFDIWMTWCEQSVRGRRWIADGKRRDLLRGAQADWNRYSRRSAHRNPVSLGSIYELARAARSNMIDLDDLEDLGDVIEAPVPDDLADLLGPVSSAPAAALPAVVADDDNPIDRPVPVDPGVNPNRDTWTSLLDRNEEGGVTSILPNVELIIRNDDRLYGRLGFNELEQCIVFVREPTRLRKKERDGKPIRGLTGPLWMLNNRGERVSGRRWIDAHTTALRSVIESPKSQGGYGIKISDRDINAAIENVARENTFHPVRDYLRAQTWDRVPRMSALYIDYLGTEDTPYYREIATLFCLGAVARAFEPGHKFDWVPILEGAQGLRKSTFIGVLGKSWSGELSCDFHDNKSVVESMQGCWIQEIPELQGFSKADTTTLKAVISRQVDRARLAYGRLVQEFPRQCVFKGSTNDKEYLRDTTGGRRFWPVECRVTEIDTERLRGEIDQIWAEAVALYDEMRKRQPHGDLPLMLKDEHAICQAKLLQDSRRSETPEDILAAEIKGVLSEPQETDLDGVETVRTVTCLKEIWIDLLGRDPRDLSNGITTRLIGKAVRMAGWQPAGQGRCGKYGSQKLYRRA